MISWVNFFFHFFCFFEGFDTIFKLIQNGMAGPSRACVHRNSIYLIYIYIIYICFFSMSVFDFFSWESKRSDLTGLVFQIVFYIFIGEFLAANSRSKVSQFEHLSSTSKVTSRMLSG